MDGGTCTDIRLTTTGKSSDQEVRRRMYNEQTFCIEEITEQNLSFDIKPSPNIEHLTIHTMKNVLSPPVREQ